jgi:hypothetical protein
MISQDHSREYSFFATGKLLFFNVTLFTKSDDPHVTVELTDVSFRTWQDGIENKRSAYTNVLVSLPTGTSARPPFFMRHKCRLHWLIVISQRLARSVRHEDTRNLKDGPPVMQVVFYQAGIGSDKNLYSEYIEGRANSYHE